MCGRGRICLSVEQVKRAGKVADDGIKQEDLKPVNNFAPGMPSPVVLSRAADESREVQQMIFGLIPHFMSSKEKPNHYTMFNARIESVTEKPSFKNLISRGKRCLVLFSGFYEWKTENKIKQPYYVYLAGERNQKVKNENSTSSSNSTNECFSIQEEFDDKETEVMKIAGLFDDWVDSTGRTMRTYTTLTCTSCSGFHLLHSRQPVFLSDDLADEWLNPKCDVPRILKELDSVEYKERYSSKIKAHPVTKKMGVAAYQDSDCHLSTEKKSETASNKIMSNYFHFGGTESPTKKPENPTIKISSSSSPSSFMKRPTGAEKRNVGINRGEGSGHNGVVEKIETPVRRVKKGDEDGVQEEGEKGGKGSDVKIIPSSVKKRELGPDTSADFFLPHNKAVRGEHNNHHTRHTSVTGNIHDTPPPHPHPQSNPNPSPIPDPNPKLEPGTQCENGHESNSEGEVHFVCHCPVCGLDISDLSAYCKSIHANSCCGKESETSTKTALLTPLKNTKKLPSTTVKKKSTDSKSVKNGSIQSYFLSGP